MKKLLTACCILLLMVGTQTLQASGKKFYLLTCDPGKEVYSLFGHTAIRLVDEDRNMDVVFNYGIFSFDTDNFIWKFARGHTDYLLAAQSYHSFIKQYRYEQRSVTQSSIQLSDQEAEKLFSLLSDNLKPENRVYRYNYFTNNCASKVRDIIIEAKGGQANYPTLYEKISYRKAVKPYMQPFPWIKLGTDLLLGAPADSLINDSTLMFLPDYLQTGLENTKVGNLSVCMPAEVIYQGADRPKAKFSIIHPLFVFGTLLILFIVLSILEFRKKMNLIGLDAALLIIMGLGGFLVAFISFVSVHPTVFPNVHILWFFPTHLVAGILLLRKKLPRWMKAYTQRSGYAAFFALVVIALGMQKASVFIIPLLLLFIFRMLARSLFLSVPPKETFAD